MARMPVLAGGMLMLWMVLTTGCQTTPTKKPPTVPTTWNNPPKNQQVTGGNPNLLTGDAGKFPRLQDPAPTPKVQPVGGGGLGYKSPPSDPTFANPGGVPPALILPGRTNTITQPTGFPDLGNPQPPPLPTPPSTNVPLLQPN